jgi:hypothetical protein
MPQPAHPVDPMLFEPEAGPLAVSVSDLLGITTAGLLGITTAQSVFAPAVRVQQKEKDRL